MPYLITHHNVTQKHLKQKGSKHSKLVDLLLLRYLNLTPAQLWTYEVSTDRRSVKVPVGGFQEDV